ncbi:hypothetical protein ACFLX5_03550 [Chloroflexota bacterium]
MGHVELVSSLYRCIETVAKSEYHEALRKLLVGESSDELEEKINILKSFLETMDFSKLRRESEKYLLRGKRVQFIVYLDMGVTKYEMHEIPFYR